MASYDKGSLKSDSYLVKRGDTLYSIAWASNKNFIDLANNNKLNKPYTIYPGQKLNLNLTPTVTNSQTAKKVQNNHSKVVSNHSKENKKQTDTSVASTTPPQRWLKRNHLIRLETLRIL